MFMLARERITDLGTLARHKKPLIMLILLVFCGEIVSCTGKGPPPILSAREEYDRAHDLYERGKWEKARLAYEAVIFNHPGSTLVDSAQYRLGMCYFKQKDPILAASEFVRVRQQYPTSPLVDDADFMRCRTLLMAAPSNTGLDQQRTREAVEELLLFKDNHPLSEYIAASDSLLAVAFGRLSQKDLKTGILYYKMGRFQSSGLYLQGMIDTYPESPLVPEALYYLGEGQRKMDSLDNAIEFYEKLIYLYPDHRRTKKARGRVAKIAREREEEAEVEKDEEEAASSDGGS